MPLQPAGADPTVRGASKGLPGAVIQVPVRDADGNAVGGVRLPDIAVPLGVQGAQNKPRTFTCALVGAYLPFPADKVAALYKDRNNYVNRVRVAAREAKVQGFLVPEDAAVIVNSAAETPIFPPPPAGTEPR